MHKVLRGFMSLSRPQRTAAAIFAMLLGVYLLTTGGHLYAIDEEMMYDLSEAIPPSCQMCRPAPVGSTGCCSRPAHRVSISHRQGGSLERRRATGQIGAGSMSLTSPSLPADTLWQSKATACPSRICPSTRQRCVPGWAMCACRCGITGGPICRCSLYQNR